MRSFIIFFPPDIIWASSRMRTWRIQHAWELKKFNLKKVSEMLEDRNSKTHAYVRGQYDP
jgi:hypothetical protein